MHFAAAGWIWKRNRRRSVPNSAIVFEVFAKLNYTNCHWRALLSKAFISEFLINLVVPIIPKFLTKNNEKFSNIWKVIYRRNIEVSYVKV